MKKFVDNPSVDLTKKDKQWLIDHLYSITKTGFNFRTMRQLLAVEQKRRRDDLDYMYVTRRTVLGRMKEIKSKQFDANFPQIERWKKREIIEVLNAVKNPKIQTIEIHVPF